MKAKLLRPLETHLIFFTPEQTDDESATAQLFDSTQPSTAESPPATQPLNRRKPAKIVDASAPTRKPTQPTLVTGKTFEKTSTNQELTINDKKCKHLCLKENQLDHLTGKQTNIRKGNSKTVYFYFYFCSYVLNATFVWNPAFVPEESQLFLSAFTTKITTMPNNVPFLIFQRVPAQILFVYKETLATRPDVFKSLTAKWPGKSFWSPALGKQGGVVILVAENTDFKCLQWQKDSSGRIVSVLTQLGDLRINLVNIYAPTNPTERKCIYDTIHEYFFPNCLKIIAGDFNCIEGVYDKFGGNSTTSTDLQVLQNVHCLFDIWRKKNGKKIECTWFNADKTIGTRLDNFFSAQDLKEAFQSCEILPCVFSDHNDSSHGPGLWRVNLELLKDDNFCNLISKTIKNHVLYQEAFTTIFDWWDFLKESIKLTAAVNNVN